MISKMEGDHESEQALVTNNPDTLTLAEDFQRRNHGSKEKRNLGRVTI